jgi:hypothetical protein
VIKKISPLASAAAVLRESDVVTHINGSAVADDCTLTLRHDERISMMHAIRSSHIGDEVQLDILRAGQPLRVSYRLGYCLYKIPGLHGVDCWPSYYIYGARRSAQHTQHAARSMQRSPVHSAQHAVLISSSARSAQHVACSAHQYTAHNMQCSPVQRAQHAALIRTAFLARLAPAAVHVSSARRHPRAVPRAGWAHADTCSAAAVRRASRARMGTSRAMRTTACLAQGAWCSSR